MQTFHRFLILCAGICLLPLSLNAIVTNWVVGNGDWNQAANWDNGVPKSADSAMIDPGSPVVVTLPAFSMGVAAHITIGASMTLRVVQDAELRVGSPLGSTSDSTGIYLAGKLIIDGRLNVGRIGGDGIFIASSGGLDNNGEVVIFETALHGAFVEGLFKNDSTLTVVDAGEEGIQTSGAGILLNNSLIDIGPTVPFKNDMRIFGSATSINTGTITLASHLNILGIAGPATLQNSGTITAELLNVSFTGAIENEGKIEIANTVNVTTNALIENDGVIVANYLFANSQIMNRDTIVVFNSSTVNPGILIDSGEVSPNVYIGTIENEATGVILVTSTQEVGIICKGSTSLSNAGEIYVTTTSTDLGLQVDNLATVTCTSTSLTAIESIGDPLQVDEGAVLDVQLGAIFETN